MITLTHSPVIETERLVLRVGQASDFPAWRAFVSTERARFIGGPLDEGRAWRSLATMIGHWVLRGFGPFIFCDAKTEQPLGMCGPWFPEGWPEPELGWSLWSAGAEGKGLAFEAVQAARGYAYAALGWVTAVSYVDPANLRSAALALRLGARIDAGAATPGDMPCHVYRHPAGVRS